MRRLWTATALLAALLAVSLWNGHYAQQLTQRLSQPLQQARTLAQSQDWAGAEQLTREAYAAWEERHFYLHTILRHSDTDRITEGFRVVLEHLEQRDADEYAASNAALLTHLELLAETEQASLVNIF